MARPTVYTDELAAEICRRISGGATLVEVARGKDMPCVRTITDWVIHNDSFYAIYLKARQAQAHVIADEIIGLVFALTKDVPDGQAAMPAVLARKYQLDNLRWYLQKMLPHQFSEQPLLALNAIGGPGRPRVNIYLPKKNTSTGDMRILEGTAVEIVEDDRDE